MNATNVSNYICGFNASGNRVVTLICDSTKAERIAELTEKAKAAAPEAVAVVLVSAEEYQQYLDGYIRGADGKPVPAPGPTDEQKLNMAKAAKLAEMQRLTAAAITGGFISAGVRYDSDTDTQITMQGICLAVDTPRFAEKYPQGCPVRGYDEGSTEKTIHMLDAAGVKAFCADLSAHIGTCKQKGWQLQQAVAAAETVETVNTITWPEG